VAHVTNVNVINVTNVTYVNRQSVTVVSQADFAAARPVGAVAIRMSPAQLQSAQVLGSGPQVVPVRASVAIGATRGAPAISARAVVARTPPPPAPVSFDARQQMLAQNHGVPLKPSQVAQIRTQQPAAVVSRPAVQTMRPAMPASAPPAPMNRPAATAPVNPADRMNSRPPGAPSVGTQPVQTRPAQPATTPQPATPAQPATQPRTAQPPAAPASTQPAAVTHTPAPTDSAPRPAAQPAPPAQRPAPAKQTKAPPRGKPEEEKK